MTKTLELQQPQNTKCFSTICAHQAEQYGTKIAYISLNGEGSEVSSHSYDDVYQSVETLAPALETLQGRSVIMLYDSGMPFVFSFLACLRVGVIAIPSPLSRPGRPSWDRLVKISKLAEVGAILTERSVANRVRSWVSSSNSLSDLPIIVTDDIESDRTVEPRQADPAQIAFLQFTSGSTGDPKGAMVTFRNLNENAKLHYRALGTTDSSRIVCWLPAYHDLGLIGNILNSIYSGATCILLPPATIVKNPAIWLQTIDKYKAQLSVAPNFAYNLAARRVSRDVRSHIDLSTWELAGNTSEPIRAETIRKFSETFKECGFDPRSFRCGYGLAESTLIVTSAEQDKEPTILTVDPAALESGKLVPSLAGVEIVSSGYACHPQKIAIVDLNSKQLLEDGTVGEIWVSGPSVVPGYFNRPDLDSNVFQAFLSNGPNQEGPYLRTGDLGAVIDGELYVVGRAKEMIIVRGRKIFPQDIEYVAVGSHSALCGDGCAAFSVEDRGSEEIVVVQEVSRHSLKEFDSGAAARAIRESVFEAFEIGIREIVFVKQGFLPKTSSGKIRRLNCRALFLEGELLPVASN